MMNQSTLNLRFRLRDVWILCLILILLYGTSVRGAPRDTEVDRFAKAYRAARTEFERRAVCLDAIDARVIAQGSSVTAIDRIFGTTWARKLPPAGELKHGIVYFDPLPPPPNDAVQAAHRGWYFTFEFDSEGELRDYSLSNLNK